MAAITQARIAPAGGPEAPSIAVATRILPSERAARLAGIVTIFDYKGRARGATHTIKLSAATEAERAEEMEAVLQEAFRLFEAMAAWEYFPLEIQVNIIAVYEEFVTALDRLETPTEVVDVLCCLLDDMIHPAMEEIDLDSIEGKALADALVGFEKQIKAIVAKLLPGENVDVFLAAREALVEDFEDEEAISEAVARGSDDMRAGAAEAIREHREGSFARVSEALDSAVSEAHSRAEAIRAKLRALNAKTASVAESFEVIKAKERQLHARLEAIRERTLTQQKRSNGLFEGIGHKV